MEAAAIGTETGLVSLNVVSSSTFSTASEMVVSTGFSSFFSTFALDILALLFAAFMVFTGVTLDSGFVTGLWMAFLGPPLLDVVISAAFDLLVVVVVVVVRGLEQASLPPSEPIPVVAAFLFRPSFGDLARVGGICCMDKHNQKDNNLAPLIHTQHFRMMLTCADCDKHGFFIQIYCTPSITNAIHHNI